MTGVQTCALPIFNDGKRQKKSSEAEKECKQAADDLPPSVNVDISKAL